MATIIPNMITNLPNNIKLLAQSCMHKDIPTHVEKDQSAAAQIPYLHYTGFV